MGSKNLLDTMIDDLSIINYHGNWAKQYEQWLENERFSFDSLLYVKNPFDLKNAGDREFFDPLDEEQINDLELIKLSLFVAQNLRTKQRDTFETLLETKHRSKKKDIIESYFKYIENIKTTHLIDSLAVLRAFAEKQAVLYGKKKADLYTWYFSTEEILSIDSVESMYMLYTYWRLTKSKKLLRQLVTSIIDFIQTYYYEYDNDPDMNLYQDLEGVMISKKLDIITDWLKLVTYHSERIFEKYRDIGWLNKRNAFVDAYVVTNEISKMQMLMCQLSFPNDEEETIKKKAIAYHSYGMWVKTADVLSIVGEIFSVLLSLDTSELDILFVSRQHVELQYDTIIKLRDHFISSLFYYKSFYTEERRYIDSGLMEILEKEAEIVSDSIDSVIAMVDSFEKDNITELLLAKQKYLSTVEEYALDFHKDKLELLTERVVKKIKENLEKREKYDELYRFVSTSFIKYAKELIKYPDILDTLVSAEYLYREFVINDKPKKGFDYSCISVMYYLALEDILNKLMYTPYSKEVLSNVKKSDWKKYVSHANHFWNNKDNCYKGTSELGNLGYLLESVKTCEAFRNYLIERFPSIEVAKLNEFGRKIKDIAPRRNNAAHGGKLLTYQDAVQDRQTVYDHEPEYLYLRGMIAEVLEILY